MITVAVIYVPVALVCAELFSIEKIPSDEKAKGEISLT